jgi:hypothetical protein
MLFMNKKIIVIALLIILIIALIGIVSVTKLGKGCISSSSCTSYCYKEGGKGAISYTPECNNMKCTCTCPQGGCD